MYLQTQVVFLLLFINNTQPKIDFVRLLKSRIHFHDSGKGFLSMFNRSIAIVQNADPVPQFRVLGTKRSTHLRGYGMQ